VELFVFRKGRVKVVTERAMAGGIVEGGERGKRAHLYNHKFTIYFAFTCIVGALGGSLFGYDLGVSG